VRAIRVTTLVLSSAVLLVSSNSFASKARLSALQFADFWKDTQNVFVYPQYAGDLGQYATLELGTVGTFSSPTPPHAEGGFARKFSDGQAGLYFNHQNTALNTAYSGAGFADQANPFFLYFGNGRMGYGLNFSYSNPRGAAHTREYSIGGAFGMKVASIDIGANLTAFGKSENITAGTSAKVLPAIDLSANHSTGAVKYYGGASLARVDVAGATNTAYSVKAGAQDHAFKLGQTGTFFYGAELGYVKTAGTKNFNLPLYAGIEADMLSWLAVRGALSQTLLGYVDAGWANRGLNTPHSTRATLGSTIKAGGFSVDGLLGIASNGVLNTTNLLTNASVTYQF
jgi:hypothetical protein